jgi:hypothetical protein
MFEEKKVMLRRVVSLIAIATVGACLVLDDSEPEYQPKQSPGSLDGSGGQRSMADGAAGENAATGGSTASTSSGGTSTGGGSGGGGSGGRDNGGATGGAGTGDGGSLGGSVGGLGGASGKGGSGGSAGRGAGGTAGKGGSGGSAGRGAGGTAGRGSVSTDGGARTCKGGLAGMCPTPYSVAGSVDDLCKAYCDCMGGPCKDVTPTNCVATCKTQIDKWDICCRINKCLTRPCDYRDQWEGDCKAAVGIQACLDKG